MVESVMATEPKSEAALIRALSEDLALEILAFYTPEDVADSDFTSLGEAAVYFWPSTSPEWDPPFRT